MEGQQGMESLQDMEGVLISGMITLLRKPGLMPDDMEREKLLKWLMTVLPVLPHAQQRAAQGDDQVRTWLNDLRKVAYDADDILDGLLYMKLEAEAKARCRLNGQKVSANLLSRSKISSMKFPFFKRGASGQEREIGNNISGSIVYRIRNLVETMKTFNFEEGRGLAAGQQQSFSSPTDIGPIVVGRKIENEYIVEFLLDQANAVKELLLDRANAINETIVCICIVGDRGVGKTTLARYVCEDARINDHFECMLWVDVASNNIGKVAKSIIDQAIGKDCCLSEDNTDLLKHRINQELSGKRYLLVYNEVYLAPELSVEVKSWLEQGGGSGSSLLILTTNLDNAHQLCPSPRILQINPFNRTDLWSFFCNKAFSDSNETCPKVFENMGKKIAEQCRGSPLLLNLMVGLLRLKKEPAEWQEVINQLEYLDIHHKSEDNTDNIIGLCYNYMSSETKQCFLFCSIFPLGYYMDKEVLIKLWMANGLLSSDGSTSPEEKGDNIFNELAFRQFFKDFKLVRRDGDLDMNKQEYRSRVVCRIPDIIHGFCKTASSGNIRSQVRYLSLGDESPIDLDMVLKNHPLARTFMSAEDPFVRTVKCSAQPKSNSLRALHLRSSLFEGDLLEVVVHMKHLRYLDLSGSRINVLPESTCSLYNLQTLNLSECLLLYQLPENMRYMRNLRHLYVHKCPKLKRMPPHLRKLIHLQTLSAYIVGEHTGNGIDEIRDLNIGDLLELYNLRKVKDEAEAKDANLVSKTKLEILTLCWGSHSLVMSNRCNDLEVLEALKPNSGLKVLKVQQYGGSEFATWLTNPVGLKSLVELHLIGCSQCKTLPAVWRLSSLQVLCLKHLASLTYICPSVDNGDSSKLFPSLKRLVLVDLKRLKRWQETMPKHEEITLKFPLLDEMEITRCPNLENMPHPLNLKRLRGSIEKPRQLWSFIDLIVRSRSLVEANITEASGDDNKISLLFGADVKWHGYDSNLRIMRLDSTDTLFMPRASSRSLLGFWRKLILLENLDICNCKNLVSWPLEEFRDLIKLKRLSFRMCPNLTGSFPRQLLEGEKHLPRLLTLELYRCVSFKEVPKCCSVLNLEVDECPEVKSISGLINLEMLFLSCTSWTSLPNGLGDLKKLESLWVSECYSLTCLPDELAGLTLLRTFIVNKCPRVNSLPDGLNQMLSGLEKFQTLECPDLEKSCRERPYSAYLLPLKGFSNFVGIKNIFERTPRSKNTHAKCITLDHLQKEREKLTRQFKEQLEQQKTELTKPFYDQMKELFGEAMGAFIPLLADLVEQVITTKQPPEPTKQNLKPKPTRKVLDVHELYCRAPILEDDQVQFLSSSGRSLYDEMMTQPEQVLSFTIPISNHWPENDTPFLPNFTDIKEMLTRQWANISIVKIFTMICMDKYRHFNGHNLTFCDPEKVCAINVNSANDHNRTSVYFGETFINIEDPDPFILVPYHEGNHWMLLLVHLSKLKVYIVDSLNPKKTSKPNISKSLETGIKYYYMKTKKQTKVNVTWSSIKCPTQLGSTECAYYVMMNMDKLMVHYLTCKDMPKVVADGTKEYSSEEIQENVIDKIADYIFHNQQTIL